MSGGEITYLSDGRYAHVPHCNKKCSDEGHWLEQATPAPWQVQRSPAGATPSESSKDTQP